MSELVLNFQLVLYKFTKMTTTSKPSFAVGQAADNLTAVLATDLVKGTKFKNLLKTITDNKDRAGVFSRTLPRHQHTFCVNRLIKYIR